MAIPRADGASKLLRSQEGTWGLGVSLRPIDLNTVPLGKQSGSWVTVS